jgi:hypothetical protein
MPIGITAGGYEITRSRHAGYATATISAYSAYAMIA